MKSKVFKQLKVLSGRSEATLKNTTEEILRQCRYSRNYILVLCVCLPAGCHSSVPERLCVKQAVLGLTPGDSQTFFSSVL